MPKSAIIYKCTECESVTPTWSGKCLSCNSWGTLERVETEVGLLRGSLPAGTAGQVISLDSVTTAALGRIKTNVSEIDRCLGGGFISGSVVLIGGDPGVGKSTLAIQIASLLAKNSTSVLYIAGEESPSQIKVRAERIDGPGSNLKILADTNLSTILATALAHKPELLIIDSIQTIYNPEASGIPGSMAQVAGAATRLVELAKRNNITTVLIGHVTKEGYIAGPKALEHIVDVVLYLEGERFQSLRLLRAVKNRFGGVNEVGVFEMTGAGLKPVANPSQLFLDMEAAGHSGAVHTCVLEGSRVIACEIQALLSKSSLAYPRRTSLGFDHNRLWLLLAVLAKHGKLPVYEQDVYVNVVGGLKIDEPGSDIAVAAAAVSSLLDVPVEPSLVLFGELGLSGEIRPVSQIEKRLSEAERLGFSKVIVAARQKIEKTSLEIIRVADIKELIRKMFGKALKK